MQTTEQLIAQMVADGKLSFADGAKIVNSLTVTETVKTRTRAYNKRAPKPQPKPVVLDPTPRKVRNSWAPYPYITCRECGGDHFLEQPRTLDYFHWKCVDCGAISTTMTETGMSA